MAETPSGEQLKLVELLQPMACFGSQSRIYILASDIGGYIIEVADTDLRRQKLIPAATWHTEVRGGRRNFVATLVQVFST